MGGKSKSKSVDTSKQTQRVMDGLAGGGMSSGQVAGMQQDLASNQWGTISPMFDALKQMGTQQMASNPMSQLMGQLFGQEQPQQPQQAPQAPQQSAYEQRIAERMQNKGETREEAIANQAYALQLGTDYNNDGAVSNDEWAKYQQMQQPQQPWQQQPQGMPQQQQLQTGGGLGMVSRTPRDMTAHEPGNPTTMPQGMPQGTMRTERMPSQPLTPRRYSFQDEGGMTPDQLLQASKIRRQ